MPDEKPDAWAEEAACLPLAFAQVREDPRLDLELAVTLPPSAEITMIASGGETAACLGRLPLKLLRLIDMNPAQLALSKLKWRLAESGDASQSAALLGHAPMPSEERRQRIERLCDTLELPAEIFGPPDKVTEWGVDHAGRYERAFHELRQELARLRAPVRCWLEGEETKPDALDFQPALEAAMERVLSLPNLVRLFGEGATQNPRRAFHTHFALQTRAAGGIVPPVHNPFLWQMFAGTFPPGCCYDWLDDPAFGSPMKAEAVWQQGWMAGVLDALPARSQDGVHLSNILDWLSPEEAAATLRSAARALKPGRWVIIRQLNSTLEIPALPSDFAWDAELGRRMAARDRSFFYPQIHIGWAR